MTRLAPLLLALALLTSARADGWQAAPNAMQSGRWAPAFCLLPGGQSALICGGYSYTTNACTASADRFDARLRRFVPSRARLTYPRDFAVAVPLPNGTVLVIGGYNTVLGSLRTVEVYHPQTDTFSLLPSSLSTPRELFTATALDGGGVLVVGGFNTHAHVTQATAELFDPHAQTWTLCGSHLADDRFGHATCRLADGHVLIVGGTHWRVGRPATVLASAEVYDPRTGLFHRTRSPMSTPRDRPTASLLPDGTVLIAGGQNGSDGPRTLELFHPDTETFTTLPTALGAARMAHADIALPDGRVVLAGGWGPDAHATLPGVEVFNPRTRTFAPGPALPWSAHDLALICFPDGLVLAAGGKQVQPGHETSVSQGAFWTPPAPEPLAPPPNPRMLRRK